VALRAETAAKQQKKQDDSVTAVESRHGLGKYIPSTSI